MRDLAKKLHKCVDQKTWDVLREQLGFDSKDSNVVYDAATYSAEQILAGQLSRLERLSNAVMRNEMK